MIVSSMSVPNVMRESLRFSGTPGTPDVLPVVTFAAASGRAASDAADREGRIGWRRWVQVLSRRAPSQYVDVRRSMPESLGFSGTPGTPDLAGVVDSPPRAGGSHQAPVIRRSVYVWEAETR